MTRVRHLLRPPWSAELYGRAAASAVLPGALWGGSSLPDQVLQLWDVRPDPQRVDRYCELTGFPIGPHLPDTFPSLLGFGLGLRLMTDRGFPLKALGMVHVQDHIDAQRPIERSELLSVSVSARNLRWHRKGTLVDIVTDVSARGAVIWTEISTYLSRDHKIPPPAGSDPNGDGPNGGESTHPSGPRIPPVPDASQTQVVDVPEDTGRRFAAISGDRNPIHLHSVSARAFGFPRAIAHGRATMACSVAAATGDYSYPAHIDTWFRAPVPLPSTCLLVTAQKDATTTEVWLTSSDRETVHVYTRIASK